MAASVFDDIEHNDQPRLLTKADIRMRMQKLVPKAFRTLEQNLYSVDDKVSTAAALGILDRCGYGPQSKVTVEDASTDLSQMTSDELRQRALDVAAQIAAHHPRQQGPFDEESDGSVH
jgi:hypothetical protein